MLRVDRLSFLQFAVSTALLMASACGPGETDGAGGSGGAGGEEPCPKGSIIGPAGACMAVGIQSCPERFVEEDGLCRPSMAKCADEPGTIPRFGDPDYSGDGCEPVGIPVELCPARFMEEDGLCHPSMAKCADEPGTIPRFGDPDYSGDGCEPVGIPGCAPELVEEDGLCHPSMEKCPEGTFAVPQEGCVPIDGLEGCGQGTWGNIADGPDTVYVDGSVAASGDGSKAAPVKTIAESLDLVPSGGRIAIAAGVYDEPMHITKDGLTVEGRCPSMVRVQGTAQALGVSVIVFLDQVTDVLVRRLEIGGDGVGIVAYDAAASSIEEVHVEGATRSGISIGGRDADVSVSRSLIRGTLVQPGSNGQGYGVEIAGHAHAQISATAVVASPSAGVIALNAYTSVTLENSLIQGTLPDMFDQPCGMGVHAANGAELMLETTSLVDNCTMGLRALDSVTMVTIDSSVVERTRPRQSDGDLGFGVALAGDATVSISSSAVLSNRSVGVAVAQTNTLATVKESLVRDTLLESDGTAGYGVQVEGGATINLEGSALVANVRTGALATGKAATANVSGVLIEGRPIDPDVEFGAKGLVAQLGAQVSLFQAAIVATHNAGVQVLDEGTNMVLVGSLIEGTRRPNIGSDPSVEGTASAGIYKKAVATIDSSAIVDNDGLGIVVLVEGTTVSVSSSLIRDTLPVDIAGAGVGAWVSAGQLAVQSCSLVANHASGLIALDGADVSATGILVEGTLPSSDGSKGMGMGIDASRADLREASLLANHHAGFLVQNGSEADIGSTLVAGTLAAESDGSWGAGIISDAAAVRVSSLLVQDNVVAGMVFNLGMAEVSDSWVEGVQPGKAISWLGSTQIVYEDVGDGVLVRKSDVVMRRNIIGGCSRAGLLFHESTGILEDVASTDSAYGLVLQGSSQPSYGHAGNLFSGAVQDVVTGGDLPVPDGTLAVPPSN